MTGLRMGFLLAATITVGMMAGVFAIYANAIMPGLAKTDDRTFVAAFQAMDRAIVNPLFLGLGFLGSGVLTLVAMVLHFGEEVFGWISVAFVLYAGTVIITGAVHLPRNDALKAAGDPDTIDVAGARAAFDEHRWRTWNVVRTILNLAAFGVLCWALVLSGKTIT